MSDYLFVYGTLRKHAERRAAGQHCYQLLQQHASLRGLGWLQAKLYLVDYYPGAVACNNPKWQVTGEVYQLKQPALLLTELDQYEECGSGFASPTEYLRLKQQVTLENSEKISAWVYCYNHPTDGLQQIMSGDFLHCL
ncbi:MULTISPECIES: gamma-glutamylcyclotransferase family protein [unclassified Arsukibacterium]|uniref:gamma-glutamylcyclotransferase family protein n=1 Tax=unclassified Arsukibacterium TaxID=2635278 RepID=UPI000C5352A6|nr:MULTISPECIES: gamma-glutamylcyclotransferase family protein [unclassified Arsukibacterium]MAA95986.1 gamma-glutamylcyclotransferase [Rheinheimera sp.]MBM33662.1 gamma-glutamylcyclotransferase [Rheinheimera sp.]HAW91389.1 gamma-glutamylcyclotransferase [Candidatus Azambacteria bacterium]|tara:strand:+ start:129063 stop:129476 length:414 start_codon:yes stop_codon:yes gene_type:complete